MLKILAFIFGLALALAGILGFVPETAPNGLLFGIFRVDTLHNLIHLISGFAGIWAATAGTVASKYFFRIFGLIYGLIAIVGFYEGERPLFGIISNNSADNILHTVIAVLALYLGFCGGCCCRKDRCDTEKNRL